MGTNYYWKHSHCQECGRIDELHIGKNSGGWRFVFKIDQEQKFTHSLAGWVEVLSKEGELPYKDEGIFNEYGTRVSWPEFKEILERSLENPRKQSCYAFYDGEHPFVDYEFS